MSDNYPYTIPKKWLYRNVKAYHEFMAELLFRIELTAPDFPVSQFPQYLEQAFNSLMALEAWDYDEVIDMWAGHIGHRKSMEADKKALAECLLNNLLDRAKVEIFNIMNMFPLGTRLKKMGTVFVKDTPNALMYTTGHGDPILVYERLDNPRVKLVKLPNMPSILILTGEKE